MMQRKWIALGTAAFLIAILVFAAVTRKHEYTYRIILPDEYVGWVRVDFAANTAPAFGPKNTINIKVGEDGTFRTPAIMVYSVPTNYEFFYTTPQGLRPVRKDFVDHEINAGGITARSDLPGYGTAWYFFVGPKSYRERHPNSEFVSPSAPLPTPGKMKPPVIEQNTK